MNRKRHINRIELFVALAVLIVVVLSIWYAVSIGSREDESTDNQPRPVSVAVAGVQLREFHDEINAVGTLTAHEIALMSPKVPGNVETVLVDIGDHVETGQILARLDRTSFKLALEGARANLATAQAAVSQAKAQHEHARKEYERASSLLSENVIPQSRFDAAEAAYKTSTQALNAAMEQHRLARTALQNAQENLDDTDLCSPINGDVVSRMLEVGMAVGPGPVLFRIVDQSSLRIDIALPEKDFDFVHTGMPADLIIDVFERRGFSGHITVVNPMVSPSTRTFLARIEVPNTDRELVDGMFAKVRLLVNKRQNLAVDCSALQRLSGSGASYVFVVRQGEVFKKSVVSGVIGDEFTEIISGLAHGDQVVTSGTGNLRQGTKVKIVTPSSSGPNTVQEEKQ